jgi:hypothetical protein
MPLPRSVVEESRDSFVARRVESKMFRGFSFIQEDFLLPNRNMDEIETYWNSVDEEGESESEGASSKVGSDDAPQPVPVELEPKKRAPRKRKKKDKVAGVAATMSVASTDWRSVLSVEGDDASARSAVKAADVAKQIAIPVKVFTQIPMPILTKESPPDARPIPQDAKVTANQVPSTSKSPVTPALLQQAVPSRQVSPQGNAASSQLGKQPPPPQQQPWAQPYSLDTSRNQKYAPPQRRGFAPIHGSSEDARPQHQHYPQQPMHQKPGWTVAHHNQSPHPQAARGWANQTTPTRPTQQTRSPPAANPTTQPLTRGPAPDSWAAKISAPKAPQPRAQPKLAQPPPSPSPVTPRKAKDIIPPSPSSDWRHHQILKSPVTMNGADAWPGLDDFPAPPTMGQPKTAIKAVKPLQGAWGTKK